MTRDITDEALRRVKDKAEKGSRPGWPLLVNDRREMAAQ